jgi:hypothetical protein
MKNLLCKVKCKLKNLLKKIKERGNIIRHGVANPIILDGNEWERKDYKTGPKYIQKK